MVNKVNIGKEAKKVLIAKSKVTGVSQAKLAEFAILNMPFIDIKKVKNYF